MALIEGDYKVEDGEDIQCILRKRGPPMTERMIGDFELRPDEVELTKCRAQTETWGPFVSKGAFNLTSDRIIWLRGRWNIVPGSDVEIKLDQIRACVADDGFNRHRVLLTLEDGTKRTFHVLVGVNASDVADAINGARAKNGLVKPLSEEPTTNSKGIDD